MHNGILHSIHKDKILVYRTPPLSVHGIHPPFEDWGANILHRSVILFPYFGFFVDDIRYLPSTADAHIGVIFLIATLEPVSLFLAAHTTPYAPTE